jgi:hypothetical protein
MPTPLRPARSAALLASLAAAAVLACSAESPTPIACDTDASCPATSRCAQRACVADAPPLAHVASIEGVEANDLAVLDGSRSSDPDAPDDAVVSYEWTVKMLDGPCDPPVVAGTTALPQVRFACAGRYEVTLVVTDEMSVRSEPASVTVDVAPRSGEPLVTVGADVAVDHRCAGEPLLCQPVTELGGAVALTAASGVEGVQFRWSLSAPEGRAIDATRRVTFEPGPDVAAPLVRIETDGTAISGDWVLRVEARDAAGVVGTAATRVSVGNAPPVVTETFVSNSHVFDAPSSRFSALGAISVVVSDPDGDPLEGRSVSGHHLGDGGATFDVTDLGDRIAFAVALPYSQPSDADFLIGGEGLERTIAFAMRDVNGAETSEIWPVVIANRPPELVLPLVGTVSTNHVYDPAAGVYRAAAKLSGWQDPDGDPMIQADFTGDAVCPSYTLDASGRTAIECSLASGMAAVAGNFVGAHDIQERVRDPWAASPDAAVSTLQILNRPPVVAVDPMTLRATCVETATCCAWEAGYCMDNKWKIFGINGTLANFVVDPDGDPVHVTLAPQGSTKVCLPAECTMVISWGGEQLCTPVAAHATYSISVTDGAASATDSFLVTRTCAL